MLTKNSRTYRCPSLADLPAPPAGRSGWPWTEESERAPETMPDGRRWPRVTIVTPSYNQGEYLEETLRSVLLQGYPELEYVVMDGGSTDGSVAILERYSRWLAYWTSQKDRGQSHAINKGHELATGEITAWLNSDDIYYPGAIQHAVRRMRASGCDIFVGTMDKVEVGPEGMRLVKRSSPLVGSRLNPFPILANRRWHDFHFFQPGMFWTRDIWERTGGLDERYDYVMDVEWCNRALALGAEVATSEEPLSRFSLHAGSKSQDLNHLQMRELAIMYWRLSRTRGFRPINCMLSSLRPVQRTLSLLAGQAQREHRRTRAFLLRTGARAVKALRYAVPGLRGADRVGDGASL